MPESLQEFGATLAAFLPNLLIAILILVVGWLVAFLISKAVQGLLHRTSLDDRLAGAMQGGSPARVPVERYVALAVFWLIMFFVIVVFLQTLNLGGIADPLNAMLANVLAFLPNLLAAAVLTLLAVVIATVLKMVITRVLSSSAFTRRFSDEAQVDSRNRVNMGQTIGNVVYWLVLLLFLPAILGALQLQGILQPVTAMVNDILTALPNIFGALVILAIGYFVARVIRQIVTNLLAGVGIDRLTERAGVSSTAMGEQRLSDVIGLVVFVLVMIPIAIAALNVLNIPAVSQPAANMLNALLNALPAIFGAALLLVIAYFAARLVGTLVSSLLAGIGFNHLFAPGGVIPMTGLTAGTRDMPSTGTTRDMPPASPGRAAVYTPETGMGEAARRSPGEVQTGRTTPAEIGGYIVMVGILLFAAMEAAGLLGFTALSVLLGEFVVAAFNILVGLVIFGLGLYLANQAHRLIINTGTRNASILAPAARWAIIIFAGALALRQMGIAEDIVNLAFGLLLGAVAVAAAIAFGLGGRDTAKALLERWRSDLNSQAARSTPPPTTPTTRAGGTIITPGEASSTLDD